MTLPQRMRAVRLIGHGGPEQLEYREDIGLPNLEAGEVMIKVSAAGVNNTDINTRLAWYSKSDNDSADASWTGQALKLPLIQGADVCGQIIAVGEGVDASRLGQRVLIEPSLWEVGGKQLSQAWYFGSECDGGFADFTKVAARHAHQVECELSDVELASFPCSYSTAENLLTRSAVTEGDTVLVTGASGGVGSAAVQLAKARGARVIAQTSPSKAAGLLELGAQRCVDRNAALVAELGENRVDVVIDLVGGDSWPDLLKVLKPFGRYACSGAIGGAIVELDLRTLYLKDQRLIGCTVLEPEVFPNLVKRIEADQVKPLVAKTFALMQMAEAQEVFQQKGHIGKLVIDMAL